MNIKGIFQITILLGHKMVKNGSQYFMQQSTYKGWEHRPHFQLTNHKANGSHFQMVKNVHSIIYGTALTKVENTDLFSTHKSQYQWVSLLNSKKAHSIVYSNYDI